MSNLILWSHQSTVDYAYRTHSISHVAGALLDGKVGVELRKEAKKGADWAQRLIEVLSQIREKGLPQDTTVSLPSRHKSVPALLQMIRREISLQEDIECDVRIGGNPAISAIRGSLLKKGPKEGETDLPIVYYAGLFPKSVQDALNERLVKDSEEIAKIFQVKYPVKAEPQTIGLETKESKLMLIYGPGRSLADLTDDANFTRFFNLLEGVIAGGAEGSRAVLAMNLPTLRPVRVGDREISELDLAVRLVGEIKGTSFGDRIRIFVSTRSFEGNSSFASKAISLLEKADIVSMNEAELGDLHTAYNKGEFRDIPRAFKLRELPLEAIKVCHSAHGVIMDLGCRPEAIITSQRFRKEPAEFLEEVLRLSADGATYAMDATAGLGLTANEAMIRIYSRNISEENRQTDRFHCTFRNITERMPAGMLWIASAEVVQLLGAVVGLGAIFDGLLLAFLMRSN